MVVKRTYDAAGRQARADAQRAAAYDVARELFLRDGYAATTVDSIAQAAGVSAATIYKTYGGKAGVVRGLCERGLAGGGPVPAETRSNALRDGDGHALVAGWGALVAEVSPRIAPLLLVLRDAAREDADAAALFEEFDAQRLRRMRDNARALMQTGAVRSDVSVDDVRDVLWLASAPELYELLVRRRGWSVKKYARFVGEMMRDALL
jgi:AcrR family transcriptional regulator